MEFSHSWEISLFQSLKSISLCTKAKSWIYLNTGCLILGQSNFWKKKFGPRSPQFSGITTPRLRFAQEHSAAFFRRTLKYLRHVFHFIWSGFSQNLLTRLFKISKIGLEDIGQDIFWSAGKQNRCCVIPTDNPFYEQEGFCENNMKHRGTGTSSNHSKIPFSGWKTSSFKQV